MPTVPPHKPGSFCGVDLTTSDHPAAKNFYTKLFGWTFDDSPIGDGAFYTMLKLNGNGVGALYQRQKQDAGVPPHWNCYVSVANVDEAAKKVATLGGKVLMPPFDVMDVGRMTV